MEGAVSESSQPDAVRRQFQIGTTMLTVTTAQMLLAPIADSSVLTVQHIANTNDVFKVVTERDGSFYVKFHTSPWYKEAIDTYVVVQREAAVVELLKRKGISLGYHAWTDCTRQVVNRSVLITSELPGIPIPSALTDTPDERDPILIALAQFLKRLHTMEFPRAGYIELCGDTDLTFSLDPRENVWWDSHPCQKPENFRIFALKVLESKENSLPVHLYASLKERFEKIPEIVGSDYQPPRFVINNYHPFHIHIRRDLSGWQVTGLYDFEAVSAGNPVFDLVGNELQITPLIGSLSWRPVFYQAYGRWPRLETYKTTLLCFLLLGLGRESSAEVPDPDWLIRELPNLLKAPDYESFKWYPF